ncbi:MAG: two-component system sensor histidine kinase NtrB [Candidatus Longimicrobiales bacterium M2_2A_002]
MYSTEGFLRWVYVARLTLAAGIFAAALLVWTQPQVRPEATLVATLALVMTLGITVASYWQTHVAEQPPTSNFLYAQALFDVLLVTAVVHITGRAESDFVPLYVLVITEGALLLPLRGGLLVGALATLLYFADAVWGAALTEALGGPVGDSAFDSSVLIRMGLFFMIAGATAWLGDRLKRTGSQLGEVESELRQLRLDTSEILATLDTGVVTVDPDGRVMYMNAAAEALLGMRADEWLGRPALEAMDGAAPGLGRVVRRTLAVRRPVRWYETHTRATPELRVLGVRSTALERDERPAVTVVLQDITDGKRAEELHRRAERLEAVTELSASLAHEIKNPLASIRSAVEQLTRPDSKAGSQDRDVLGRLVLTESDRLSRLLSGFIEFSRVRLEERVSVDMAEVAREATEVVRQHPEAGGRTPVELEVEPATVEGDPDLLHRVVFNLVLNAVQHSPDGASVEVDVAPVPTGALPPGVELTDAVRVRVADRGPGIAADDVGRVFDPFYTTREHGSGLGLALVHRAVEAHGGRVVIDSVEGEGTTFSVFLRRHLEGE